MITLNHTIVPARDRVAAARFFARLFGLTFKRRSGHFAPVRVNKSLTLLFDDDKCYCLLRRDGKWYKPMGSTATTHILKPQIGRLPNGIDLSNSVENDGHTFQHSRQPWQRSKTRVSSSRMSSSSK